MQDLANREQWIGKFANIPNKTLAQILDLLAIVDAKSVYKQNNDKHFTYVAFETLADLYKAKQSSIYCDVHEIRILGQYDEVTISLKRAKGKHKFVITDSSQVETEPQPIVHPKHRNATASSSKSNPNKTNTAQHQQISSLNYIKSSRSYPYTVTSSATPGTGANAIPIGTINNTKPSTTLKAKSLHQYKGLLDAELENYISDNPWKSYNQGLHQRF